MWTFQTKSGQLLISDHNHDVDSPFFVDRIAHKLKSDFNL